MGGGGISRYYRGVVVKPISGVYDVTLTSSAAVLHCAAPAAMTRTGPTTTTMTKAISSPAVSLMGGEEGVEVENPSEKNQTEKLQKYAKRKHPVNRRRHKMDIYSYTCATVVGGGV